MNNPGRELVQRVTALLESVEGINLRDHPPQAGFLFDQWRVTASLRQGEAIELSQALGIDQTYDDVVVELAAILRQYGVSDEVVRRLEDGGITLASMTAYDIDCLDTALASNAL